MSFSIVLTLKPHLHVAVDKGGFARGRNCDNGYSCPSPSQVQNFLGGALKCQQTALELDL